MALTHEHILTNLIVHFPCHLMIFDQIMTKMIQVRLFLEDLVDNTNNDLKAKITLK